MSETKLTLTKPEQTKTPGQRLSAITGTSLVGEDKDSVTLFGQGRLLAFGLGDGYEHAEVSAIHNFGRANEAAS